MPENLLTSPSLVSTMTESPLYRVMGVGLTDAIFLLGHADALPLNDPYLITSMKDMQSKFAGDKDSPLYKAALETYYAGARDIWLVASAPMSEYKADLVDRDAAYYTTYQTRLNVTYSVLRDWDITEIVVPLEAPFNSTVDFLGPLAVFCQGSYDITGAMPIGLLGTRGTITQGDIDAMVSDVRPSSLGAAGKFVTVLVGDITLNMVEFGTTHVSGATAVAAAELAQMPLDRGLTSQRLSNAFNTSSFFSTAQVRQLAEAKLNAIGTTVRARRGFREEVIVHTDNTLAEPGSDFWAISVIRLAARVADEIRFMGHRRLGTISFPIFQEEVEDYLQGLSATNVLRGYTLDIIRDPNQRTRVLVDLSLQPYTTVRQIHVPIFVGPSLD